MEAAAKEKFFDLYPEVRDIVDNPILSSTEKRDKMLPFVSDIRGEKKRLKGEIASAEKELSDLEGKRDAISEAVITGTKGREWLDFINKDEFNLERNGCSRLHNLAEEMEAGRVFFYSSEDKKASEGKDGIKKMWSLCHSFVIEHDWAEAFKGASDYDGEVEMPYPVTAFEFRVSGSSVIIVAIQDEDGEVGTPYGLLSFVKVRSQWTCLGHLIDGNKAFYMLHEEIRAVCVALEAEIAIENTVRASVKLNKKRVEKAKLPLFDYHVVSLNRKFNDRFNGGGTHRNPRFHFRRGHWRHYQNHKTYIKWMLVGSPELGFIDKHYKL